MVSCDRRTDRRAARRQCSSVQRTIGSVVAANGHETALALPHDRGSGPRRRWALCWSGASAERPAWSRRAHAGRRWAVDMGGRGPPGGLVIRNLDLMMAPGTHQGVLARRHRARGRIMAVGFHNSEIFQAGGCLHDVRAMEPAGLARLRVDQPILALPVQLAFVADGVDHGARHWHLNSVVCRRLASPSPWDMSGQCDHERCGGTPGARG